MSDWPKLGPGEVTASKIEPGPITQDPFARWLTTALLAPYAPDPRGPNDE